MIYVRKMVLPMLLACAGASTQTRADDTDWKEGAVAPPPAFVFEEGRLIRLETPSGSTLTFGIDPATLSVTPDGVVRYVMIASSAGGARNVMYEGIRCDTGQHRVYARFRAEEGWSPVVDGDWQSLFGSAATRHALILARSGACSGHAATRSVDEIIRKLKTERGSIY